jgi:hypothetical protein
MSNSSSAGQNFPELLPIEWRRLKAGVAKLQYELETRLVSTGLDHSERIKVLAGFLARVIDVAMAEHLRHCSSTEQVATLMQDRIIREAAMVYVNHPPELAVPEFLVELNEGLTHFYNGGPWPDPPAGRLSPGMLVWGILGDRIRFWQVKHLELTAAAPGDDHFAQSLEIPPSLACESIDNEDDLSYLLAGKPAVTRAKAARILHVTDRQIRNLARDGKLQRIGEGQNAKITSDSIRKRIGIPEQSGSSRN